MPRSSGYRARRIKQLVDRRDGDKCRRCGHEVWGDFSRHHRIPRGAGGSAVVDRVSNILKLCGSGTTGCHGWIEKNRTAAKLLGYLLPKLNPDIDPEDEPIFIHQYGWVLLGDNGSITPCAAPRREVT